MSGKNIICCTFCWKNTRKLNNWSYSFSFAVFTQTKNIFYIFATLAHTTVHIINHVNKSRTKCSYQLLDIVNNNLVPSVVPYRTRRAVRINSGYVIEHLKPVDQFISIETCFVPKQCHLRTRLHRRRRNSRSLSKI